MNEQHFNRIFNKVLSSQSEHSKFLLATQKNLSIFYFGKDISLMQNTVMSLFPKVNMVNSLQTYSPEPYNPLQYLLNAFMDEITGSDWDITVSQYPYRGEESEIVCDFWEEILKDTHARSKRRKYFKPLLLEMLLHGYSCMYYDGWKNIWYPLTSYQVIPGDSQICNWENQPMITRITKATGSWIKCNCDDISGFELLNEENEYKLYDVWVKDKDLNILYTDSGKVVYSQCFPHPKIYPFFGPIDSDILNSFYSVPVVLTLSQLLYKYQDSVEAIETSAASIARPMLVYDVDSGIDPDQVVEGIESRYKNIMVGKNREGDINYKQPAGLPQYAINQSNDVLSQMMRVLGINPAFLGNPMAGVRERGALSSLIKASFRELSSKAKLLEEAFSELDDYILRFNRAHRTVFGQNQGIKLQDIFFPESKLTVKDYLVEFSSKDTSEEKGLSISKYRNGLISQELVLKELGYNQPRKIIRQQAAEAKQKEIDKIDLQSEIRDMVNKNILQRISEKLKGRLEFRYWLTPIAGNRVLVKVDPRDMVNAGRLLAKYEDVVEFENNDVDMYEGVGENPTEYQSTKEVASTPSLKEQTDAEQQQEIQAQMPQAPAEEEQVQQQEEGMQTPQGTTAPSSDKIEMLRQLIAKKNATAPEQLEEVGTTQEIEKPSEIEDSMRMLGVIQPTPEMIASRALFFSEPTAKNMWNGKQKAFIKTRYMPDLVDEPMLLAGSKLYGIITVKQIAKDFDFEKMREYHLVSDEDRDKRWGSKQLYLYAFEMQPFEIPLSYDVPNGANNIISNIKGVKL